MFNKIKNWFTKKKPKCTEKFVNESMNYKVEPTFKPERPSQPPEPPKKSYETITYARHKKASERTNTESVDNSFVSSVAVGYVTNDGLVGGIVGGDLVGGMIGDALNTSESTSHNTSSYESPSYDSGPSSSYDSSSYDSSSYDSGSSGCDMGGGDF